MLMLDLWLQPETPGVTHFGAYHRPPDGHFFTYACVDRSTLLLKDKVLKNFKEFVEVPCLQFRPQEIQIVRILWKNFKDSNKHSSHQRICLYQCKHSVEFWMSPLLINSRIWFYEKVSKWALYWIPRINFHSRVNSGFQDYIGNCFTWRAVVPPTGILCWFGFCKFSFDYFDDSVDVDFDLVNHSPCE